MVNLKGPRNAVTDFGQGHNEFRKFVVHAVTKIWSTFPVCRTQEVQVLLLHSNCMRNSPRECTVKFMSISISKFSSTE
jgi:hypothetical protein